MSPFAIHFKKSFALTTGLLASVALFSLPLKANAVDLSLASHPHASDIQPEVAKKATKATSEKELKNHLNDAELQVKEAETSLKQSMSDHKKGQATTDQVATHREALSDNISALNDQIKTVEAAPKSAAHTKMLKAAKAKRDQAQKILDKAQQITAE